MKDIRSKHLRFLLYPLSLLYGVVVAVRNYLFDKKVLGATSYPFPVIVIGNTTVGGTGKTPMTEYLIRLLQDRFSIAVLSRGYRRKSKGFLLGNQESSASTLGDEPCQMVRKFPKIAVAVDGDRRNGISLLRQAFPENEAIILDDAFQHRYVKPGLSLLLMDCKRPIFEDYLLPFGDLREPLIQVRRADVVLVTKCSQKMLPIEKRIIRERLDLRPHQKLYFTTLVYGDLHPLLSSSDIPLKTLSHLKEHLYSILIVTGIAHNKQFVEEIGQFAEVSQVITFEDHHHFDYNDLKRIEECFRAIPNKNKCIVVTEKDAVRLREMKGITLNLQTEIYYLPIVVDFLDNDSEEFNKAILDYVGKNKRDGVIY